MVLVSDENPPLKRIRLSDEEPTQPTQSPSEAANLATISSIKTLHHSIQQNARNYVQEYIKLLALQACQLETLSKYATDTFIPRFAQLSFTLTASKQVSKTPEFALLADAYTKDLAEFQKLTKSRIVAAAKLELMATQHAIIRLIVDC